MLEIKELCVSYEKIPTVKNVSFKVQQGQIVGLVGESGSRQEHGSKKCYRVIIKKWKNYFRFSYF